MFLAFANPRGALAMTVAADINRSTARRPKP